MEWERQWQKGVAAVAEAFSALPETGRDRVRALSLAMLAQKERMQEMATKAGAATICATCGGACCVSGRYHFTAADLVVYLATGHPLFTPRFDNGLCPFLGEPHCLIPAAYRPFNCITFNCEAIEDRLPPEEVARFYLMERELRQKYLEIRAQFPGGAAAGPLLRE